MDTEKLIKETAHCLFMQLGVKNVTMDDIAHECGVSKKTLYVHFASKSVLVNRIFTELLQNYEKMLNSSYQKGENAIDAWWKTQPIVSKMLIQGNPLLGKELKRRFPDTWKTIEGFQTGFLYTSIVQHLQRGIDEGLFRKELNVEVIALMRLQQMEAIANGEYEMPKTSRQEVFEQLSSYYMYGLVSSKGIQLLDLLTNNQ